MDKSPLSEKYVRVNQRTTSIELTLPAHLEKYAAELKAKITKEFGFALIDHSLEARIQTYIEEFLKEKGGKSPL
jgi:hypothetical protein